MYFLIKGEGLLRKYNTNWDKVICDIKKEFDSKPVYNQKFLKTKIKSYGEETADLHYKEMPETGSN